jgi:hypothetical protein
MSTAKTNFAENLVATWMLTASAATRPTAWFVALHSADPGEDAATAELSGSGYARQSIAFSVTGDTAENTALITFGPASADWSAATHFSIWSASTSGNPFYKDVLANPRTILNGDRLEIAIGALTLREQ